MIVNLIVHTTINSELLARAPLDLTRHETGMVVSHHCELQEASDPTTTFLSYKTPWSQNRTILP